jgi:hypothetical protein
MKVAADSSNHQVSTSNNAERPGFNQAVAAANDKICWIEVKQMPYLPDQQVELLHLQAEADALLLQLQAIRQKRQAQLTGVRE